jgi:hypothetical protein
VDIFRSGNEITVEIPLVDADEFQLVSTAVEYRVLDEIGNIVVPLSLTSFAAGDNIVSITVPAISNELALDKIRGLRVVDLKVTLESGQIVYIQHDYALEIESNLIVMTNSYQTLSEAKLLTLEMTDMKAWLLTKDRQRTAAMVEAFDRIGRLTFNISGSYIPSDGGISLNEFLISDFNALPDLFISAVKKAQISEADIILGGDPIHKKREDGLMSDSVGESSVMFRPGKPLLMSVSRRTLDYLAGWVSFSARMGRS